MGNEGSQPLKYGEQLDNDLKVTWSKIAAKDSPNGRDGHCACAVGSKCYVFGGVLQKPDGSALELNSLLTFDIDSSTWSELSCHGDIPAPRSAATLAAVGSKLYLFGGLSQDSGWFDDCYEFNTENNTWKKLNPEGKGPSPRDKLASATIGDKLYIFGGFGPQGGDEDVEEVEEFDEDEEAEEDAAPQDQQGVNFGWFNDLFILDTSSCAWSSPMQMNLGVPTARAAHTMCAMGGKFLVIFGGKDSQTRRNDLHIFDTESRKWVVDLQKMQSGREPEPRSFHSMAVVGHRLVVIGGRGTSNNHYGDVHIYDTKEHQWLQPVCSEDSSTFPGRGLHVSVVVGDSLLVFGGSSDFSPETMQCHRYHSDVYAIKTDEIVAGKCTESAFVNKPSSQEDENDSPKAKKAKS